MAKNATNVDQSTSEATIGIQTDTLPTQELTPQQKMEALLKEYPDLASSLQKPKIDIPIQNVPITKDVERTNRIFVLDNPTMKGNVMIDLVDDVVFTDPKTGEKKTRRMRVIRGATSIWQDEQGSMPKEHVSKVQNQITLNFSRGRCVVPVHETMKIQAALISNRNTDNPDRVGHKNITFHEWNPEKQALEEEKRQNLIIEAMQIAATAKYEDLLQHALYLAVPVVDEMGISLSPTSVRTAYSKKAMNEPEKFLNSIHSPVVKTAHLVRRAIAEAKIDLGKQPNQAFWVDGGFIATVPQGRDSVDFLIEFAMLQTDDSQKFVHQLKALLS